MTNERETTPTTAPITIDHFLAAEDAAHGEYLKAVRAVERKMRSDDIAIVDVLVVKRKLRDWIQTLLETERWRTERG